MNPIYLDYNATTPLDPRVLEAMMPYLQTHFGNPSSQGHTWGWTAEKAVKDSRQNAANFLGCQADELFFTSGSTESNNWAILGTVQQLKLQNPNEKIHILTSAVEHNCVLKSLQMAEKLYGVECDFIALKKDGSIDLDSLEKLIKPHTRLISLIWVNNEIGSLNPIAKISEITKSRNIWLHTDATQAIGKIHFQLKDLSIDLLSLSGHKIYGPKGVGLLYKRKSSSLKLSPYFSGGGQESGLRSGTLNVPGIVGLGEAMKILSSDMKKDLQHSLDLQKRFWQKLQEHIPGVQLNGSPISPNIEDLTRSIGNLSITFPKSFPGGFLQDPQLGVSAGSACHSGNSHTSHVLKALGFNEDAMSRTLRLSFGRWTTPAEVDEACLRLAQSLSKL